MEFINLKALQTNIISAQMSCSTRCRLIQNLLPDRRFYVELNNERSRWRIQKNGLPQGSVLSPTLFNIYTNDQIQNPFLTAQSTQIKSVISVPIKDLIHHYPRAVFNDIPRVGAHFYDIPGSGRTFTTYPGRGAV